VIALGEIFHTGFPHRSREFSDCGFTVFGEEGAGANTNDPGIGEEDVDIALFGGDAGSEGLKRVFGSYVPLEGDDGFVHCLGGSSFEGFFAPSDYVHGFGTVGIEGFVDREAESGSAACDDRDEAADTEEVVHVKRGGRGRHRVLTRKVNGLDRLFYREFFWEMIRSMLNT